MTENWRVGGKRVGCALYNPEPSRAVSLEPGGASLDRLLGGSGVPEVTHRMIETNRIRLCVAEQGG